MWRDGDGMGLEGRNGRIGEVGVCEVVVVGEGDGENGEGEGEGGGGSEDGDRR